MLGGYGELHRLFHENHSSGTSPRRQWFARLSNISANRDEPSADHDRRRRRDEAPLPCHRHADTDLQKFVALSELVTDAPSSNR